MSSLAVHKHDSSGTCVVEPVDTNKSGEDGVNKNHQHSVVDGSDNPNSLSTLHDPEEDLRHIGSQFGKAGEGRGPCNVAEEDDKDNANEK